jgi:hypothetical protein
MPIMDSPMTKIGDLRHCATMYCAQRRIAQAAPTPEAAEAHHQMAMLYKAQFRLLRSRIKRLKAGA